MASPEHDSDGKVLSDELCGCWQDVGVGSQAVGILLCSGLAWADTLLRC